MNYAFFISPHGFGHASRSLALMEALLVADDQAFFHLFTTVPEWFFKGVIGEKFTYRHLACDVGFVQRDPFSSDFTATHKALADLLPFRSGQIDAVCRQLAACSLAICDISPLGIFAGKRAGIPSVLVENFTWDDIYAFYSSRHPFLKEWIDLLQRSFSVADFHIQTEPLCRRNEGADLLVGPMGRRPEMGGAEVRRLLAIDKGQKIVLVSFGGFPWKTPEVEANAARFPDAVFVVPADIGHIYRQGNVIFLPKQNEVSHVAIVHAADALICKAGYSTLAEGYCAGVPVAAIVRDDYPESPALAAFVEYNMGGICLPFSSVMDGSWFTVVPKLLSQGRRPSRQSAAGEVAAFLLDRL